MRLHVYKGTGVALKVHNVSDRLGMMSIFRSGALLILSILLLEVSRTQAKVRIALPANFFDEVKTKLTWSVFPLFWTFPNLSAEIKNAFDFWENHTRFTFEEISPIDTSANIRIHILMDPEGPYSYFTEDNNKTIDVARTIYDPKGPSGVVFVTDYKVWLFFSKQNKNALNIVTVVKHQLGYILGQKDTAVFSSIMKPSYQITNISNLTKAKKDSYYFDIEVNAGRTVINESYKMPQNICKPKFDVPVRNKRVPFSVSIGKYLYNDRDRNFGAVRDYWPQLPENLTKIDGLYPDPRGFEVFFIGNQAYAINNTEFLDVPAYLPNIWLKGEGVDHVDFVFRHKTGMYVIKGESCWKFDQASDDNYTVKTVKVDFSTSSGNKKATIEGNNYYLELRLRDETTFDWLGFACQLGQEKLVPPECCNL